MSSDQHNHDRTIELTTKFTKFAVDNFLLMEYQSPFGASTIEQQGDE